MFQGLEDADHIMFLIWMCSAYSFIDLGINYVNLKKQNKWEEIKNHYQ